MKSVEVYDPMLGVWDFLADFDNNEDAEDYVRRKVEDDRRNPFIGKTGFPHYFIRDNDFELMSPLPEPFMRDMLNQMKNY